MPPLESFLYNIRYYMFFAFGFAMMLLIVGLFIKPEHIGPILASETAGLIALGLAGAQIGYLLVSRARESSRHSKLGQELVAKMYYLRGKFDLAGGFNFTVLMSLLLAAASFLLVRAAVHPYFAVALALFFLFRAFLAFTGKRSILVGHSNDAFVYDITGTVVFPWHKIKDIRITRGNILLDVGSSYDLAIPLYTPFNDHEEDELIRLMQEIQIQAESHGVRYTDFFIQEGKNKQDELPPGEKDDKNRDLLKGKGNTDN